MNKWMIWGEKPYFWVDTPMAHQPQKKNPAPFLFDAWICLFLLGKQDMFQAITPKKNKNNERGHRDNEREHGSLHRVDCRYQRLGSLSFNEQFPYIENMFA